MKSFNELLSEALAEWPEQISLRIQRLSGGRCIVVGLTDLEERICTAHLHADNEIIFRNLHWAIATAIHETARNWPRRTLKIRASAIRADLIREKFESDLVFQRDDAELIDYVSERDRQMIEAYFRHQAAC